VAAAPSDSAAGFSDSANMCNVIYDFPFAFGIVSGYTPVTKYL
jgi:hypothetical protein